MESTHQLNLLDVPTRPTTAPAPRRVERALVAPAQPAPIGRLPILTGGTVTLVDINTVRAFRGLDAESVLSLVDCGQLRWVWDFAAGDSRRELRFLVAEVFERKTLTESQAIDAALGTTQRTRLRGSELEQRWVVSAQLLQNLARLGEIESDVESHTRWFGVHSIRQFISRRLVN